jgi:hypothetical protein
MRIAIHLASCSEVGWPRDEDPCYDVIQGQKEKGKPDLASFVLDECRAEGQRDRVIPEREQITMGVWEGLAMDSLKHCYGSP